MEEKKEMDSTKKQIVKVDVKYEHIDEDIDRVAADKRCADVNAFLGQLLNALDIGRSVKKVVDPNLDYVVKFTPELLKKMEEHEMIIREKVPFDDRLKKICPTSATIKMKEDVDKDIQSLENRMISGISQESLNTFVEVVQKMIKNMEVENEQ